MYCRTFRLRASEADQGAVRELVALLLASGADPNAELYAAMIAGSEWDTCLIAAFPSVEVARLLLEHGADPNASRGRREDCNQETYPLDAAAGNSALVDLLVQFGATQRRTPAGGSSRRGQRSDRVRPCSSEQSLTTFSKTWISRP